jgi:prevent-host-death family protein
MPEIVNIHEAKTHLSRLIECVQRGERITIAKAGRPVAVLGPLDGQPRRKPGHDRIVIGRDFDEPISEFDLDYMHPADPLRGIDPDPAPTDTRAKHR